MAKTINKSIIAIAMALSLTAAAIGQTGNARAATTAAAGWEVDNLVNAASYYINEYWSRAFAANGWRYTPPRIVRTTSQTIDNAEYDPSSNTIYYNYYFFKGQLETYGDFAVVTILAHEWGHCVQFQLINLFPLTALMPVESTGWELQADCYAGVFAKHEGTTPRLDQGDIEKAMRSLYAAGDWLGIHHPASHGTPEQRMSAFETGLNKGQCGCSSANMDDLSQLPDYLLR